MGGQETSSFEMIQVVAEPHMREDVCTHCQHLPRVVASQFWAEPGHPPNLARLMLPREHGHLQRTGECSNPWEWQGLSFVCQVCQSQWVIGLEIEDVGHQRVEFANWSPPAHYPLSVALPVAWDDLFCWKDTPALVHFDFDIEDRTELGLPAAAKMSINIQSVPTLPALVSFFASTYNSVASHALMDVCCWIETDMFRLPDAASRWPHNRRASISIERLIPLLPDRQTAAWREKIIRLYGECCKKARPSEPSYDVPSFALNVISQRRIRVNDQSMDVGLCEGGLEPILHVSRGKAGFSIYARDFFGELTVPDEYIQPLVELVTRLGDPRQVVERLSHCVVQPSPFPQVLLYSAWSGDEAWLAAAADLPRFIDVQLMGGKILPHK